MTRQHLNRQMAAFARGRYLPRAIRHAAKHATLSDCQGRCVYCGSVVTAHSITLDHVRPLAGGGTNCPANLVAACTDCNHYKADLTPESWFFSFPLAAAFFLRYAPHAAPALRRVAQQAVQSPYHGESDVATLPATHAVPTAPRVAVPIVVVNPAGRGRQRPHPRRARGRQRSRR